MIAATGSLNVVYVVLAVVGSALGLVALYGFGRVALGKGAMERRAADDEAQKKALEKWESLYRAGEEENRLLLGKLTTAERDIQRLDGLVKQQASEIAMLKAQPKYGDLLATIADLIALTKSSLENEHAIRQHSHEIKGAIEGVHKELVVAIEHLPVRGGS